MFHCVAIASLVLSLDPFSVPYHITITTLTMTSSIHHPPSIIIHQLITHTHTQLNAQGVTSCIRLYGEARQLGRAISMLTKMDTHTPMIQANEHHFGALIHAARKAGQWCV